MPDAPHIVLVTGASGFLGSHLCPALAAVGWRVRGLRTFPGEVLPDCCEAADAADITDRAGVRAAVAGAESVVHLAAYAHIMRRRTPRDLELLHQVNVVGSRTVAEESVAAGVRRLVLISSVKAVGEGGDDVWTEAVEPRPLDPYGASKLAAEEEVRAACAAGPCVATILRFPLVYGPGMRANMLRFFALVRSGVPLPIAGIGNRRSVLYVGNAVAGIVAALTDERAGGGIYFLADRRAVSTDELAAEVAAALGRPSRLIRFPGWALRSVGCVGDAISTVVPFPVTSGAVRRLTGSLVVDAGKFSRDLGFEPPFSLEEGLRVTAAWFLAQEKDRR